MTTSPYEDELKTCGCGRSYDDEAWAKLPQAGVMRADTVELELRQCSCRSTMARIRRKRIAAA